MPINITYQGESISIRRGLAGISLTAAAEGPDDLFRSIDAVAAAGYDELELRTSMIAAFLDAGNSIDQLIEHLEGSPITPHIITALVDLELPEGPGRDELKVLGRRMFEVAKAIGCPYVQAVALDQYPDFSWKTIRKETGRGLREIADIAAEYGLRIAYEPMATFPVETLEQALEVIQEAGSPENVGVIVDTYHIHAGGGELSTIRQLDPALMPTVHLGDTALPPHEDLVWSLYDRWTLPGDGVVPMADILAAVLDMGYRGFFSDEIMPERYFHWDRARLAQAIKDKGDAVMKKLS